MKNFCISILFFNLFFANFANANNSTGPVKIAILGDTEEFKSEVNLLTAKLSEEKNLAVLDRADIDIILKEHEIFLSDISKNSIHLGKLLGADGVLIVKEIESGKQRFLSTRLVAVNPGVILDAFVFPLDIKSEILNWPDSVRLHFAPLFEKLSVSKDDALPVSLLNFRFATVKENEIVWEKDLNMLVLHRLILEKRVFVNERWNLGQASFEKDFNENMSDFWTGAKIVDGILNADNNGVITAQVRIRSPEGKENTALISGDSGKLPELAIKITDFILADSQIKSEIPAFNREKEAFEYRREAEWAYDNGLYEVALQAADAAWTLGDNSPELAFTRIKACGGQLFKEIQFEDCSCSLNGRRAIITDNPEKYIDELIYGLEINIMLFKQFEEETLPSRRDSVSLLRLASVVLHSAYNKGLHAQEKYRDKIATLRSLSRNLFKLDTSIKDTCKYAYHQQYAYYLFFSYMGFFSDDFIQMKELFEKTVNVGDPYRRKIILECLQHRMADAPLFVDWESLPPGDAQSQLLKEYLQSLISSENDCDKVNGIILANTVPAFSKAFDFVPEKTMDLLWNKREQIIKCNPTPEGYEALANFLSFYDFRENTDDTDKYVGFLLKYLDFYMEEYGKNKKLDWEFLYRLLLGISSRRTADNTSPYRNLNIAGKYSDSYSRLEEFKAANQDLFLAINNYYPNNIYERLKDILKGKTETTNLVEYERKVEGVFVPFNDFCSEGERPGNLRAFGSSSDTVYAIIDVRKNNGTKFITAQMLLEIKENLSKKSHLLPDEAGTVGKSSIPRLQFHGSNIICDQDRKIYYVNPMGTVWVFDPAKNEWKIFYASKHCFQNVIISRGYMYIAFGIVDLDVDEQLSRMNGKKTAQNPAEREKLIQMKEAGTGIVRISLTDGSENLLASSRRKPGSTPLDDRTSYSVKKMMEDKEGILYMLIERTDTHYLYAYNPISDKWKMMISKPNQIRSALKNGALVIGEPYYTHQPGSANLQTRKIFPLRWDMNPYDTEPVLTFRESGNTNIRPSGKYATLDKGLLYTFWKYDYSGSFLDSNYGFYVSQQNRDIFLEVFSNNAERETVVPVSLCGKDEIGWDANATVDSYEMTENYFWFHGLKCKTENKKLRLVEGIWRISKNGIAKYLDNKLKAPLIVGKNKSAGRTEILADSSSVEITSSDSNVVLRYTLDGSNPDEDSPVYKTPLLIKPGMTVKAKAFKKDSIPSDISSKTFVGTNTDKINGYIILH